MDDAETGQGLIFVVKLGWLVGWLVGRNVQLLWMFIKIRSSCKKEKPMEKRSFVRFVLQNGFFIP